MPQINHSVLAPYTAPQMFSLVNDVEAYPQFLPWCQNVQVLHRNEQEVQATIFVAKGGLHTAFTTRNHLAPPERIILHLLRGPFRHLEGVWRFQPLGEAGCRVSLNLGFELSSRLLSLTLGPLFSHMADSMVDAFVARAHQVYGAV